MPPISRRKFFVHSAHNTIAASAGLAALASHGLPVEPEGADAAEEARERPVRLCLVSGSLEYRSDESLSAFQEHLEKGHPAVKCSRAFMRTESDLPGLENLERCDCMLLFTRRLTISGEPLERVKRYCARGGPIVAVRTASHAFQNWLALDKEVLGGDYQGHYGEKHKPKVSLVAGSESHPVLRGVEPFTSAGSLYKNPKLAGDVTRLMEGRIPEHTEPVAWVRLHRGGRVFYTSLGHPDEFRQPSFLRLLVNAIFWTTRRE
jgi:type 1 glutamine amidotransferase